MKGFAVVLLALMVCFAKAQDTTPAFEVATVRPAAPDAKAGRYITMQGTNRFVAKYYTLKLLIAAAYNLSAKVISGGPAWADSDHFDILALTPGDTRPNPGVDARRHAAHAARTDGDIAHIARRTL
jgi:hypothetical protein